MNELINTHKLTRITFVNWYLFGAIDIAIEGNSILFRGANGVGKSSIIDGLQTVLAGGDENLLMMNAASSDGKRSGRSIRSYVLGEVAESPGQKACEPRSESNCYICLSFMSKTGKPFVFGLGLYARVSDPRSLQKYPFIIEGNDLSSMDFMRDEHTVLPWKYFEQRVKDSHGKLSLPQSARDFRQQYCELMSAEGARHSISPDMMFRAVRNGLTFKTQKDISEFARKYILPDNDIDVVRIENDYREYKKINSIIAEAKDRLEALTKIIKHLSGYKRKHQRSLAYKWTEQEACFNAADLQVENLETEELNLRESMRSLQAQIQDLEQKTQGLQDARDEAMTAYRQSATQQALQACRDSIRSTERRIADNRTVIGAARSGLAEIEQSRIPPVVSERLMARFEEAHERLKRATGFGQADIMQQWPVDTDNVDETLAALEDYRSLLADISAERDGLLTEFEKVEVQYRTTEDAIKKSADGKASLMPQTERMMALLAHQGIEAAPVCDLAEITDETWQIGVERFLGGNREALVVLSIKQQGSGAKDDFDHALALYRREKDNDASLRSVKLINPDKIFGSDDAPPAGTAGGLIKSDNSVALRYLRGLLHNVMLVDTEEELRRSRRAITKDGMVAGSGTIGGGSAFKWILIGQDARKRQVQSLRNELANIQPEYDRLRNDLRSIDQVKERFGLSVNRCIEKCIEARPLCEDSANAVDKLNELRRQEQQLEAAGDDALKKAYESADKTLREHTESLGKAHTDQRTASYRLDQVVDELPRAKKNLDDAAAQRRETSDQDGFDQTEATRAYEELTEKHGDEQYDLIKAEAFERSSSNAKAAESDKEDGIKALVEFTTRYELEDKREIAAMAPLDALERCREHAERIENAEIIGYLSDAEVAQEKMLASFRSEVVAKLKECFSRIDDTFKILNSALSDLTFNSNRYQFTWPLVDVPTLRTVHEYVTDTSDLELDSVGDMFDQSKDHPAVALIQQILVDGRLQEISDYRNFYSYDIIATDVVTETRRKFSELLSVGSGGEQQSPFYVALGASFMTAYKLRKVGDSVFGGAAIALFDEAFSKMDGNNAKAALRFFSDIGLQVILAAPPESEIKVGPYVDKAYSVIRAGDTIYLDHKAYTEKGRALLESDDPTMNPEIVEAYVADVKGDLSVE